MRAGARPQLTVLRTLGLGGLLTAVPALRGLARAFPEHRRRLAAPAWLEPLLPLIADDGRPYLDGLRDFGGPESDPAALPLEPDIAVNLHGSGPESHRVLLATRPRQLIAFRNDAVEESRWMPAWDPEEHEAKRWCRLLEGVGIAADAAELEIERPEIELPAWARGATLLHPGAAGAARRWPPERWSALARAEVAAGHEVLVTGSRKEVGLARSIAAAAGLDPRRELAGRTDLFTLAAFVSSAGAVVCGDTGVAHLATALGVPSVLLFGPTSPRLSGPPEDRGIHRVLWEGRSGDPHADSVTDPVDAGLLEIEVEAVLGALDSIRAVAAL